MPARDYKKEYRDYHGKPGQKKNRAARNRARTKLGLKKGDPREVDHKKPMSKGGGNGKANLRAVSFKTNRKKGCSETMTIREARQILSEFFGPQQARDIAQIHVAMRELEDGHAKLNRVSREARKKLAPAKRHLQQGIEALGKLVRRHTVESA